MCWKRKSSPVQTAAPPNPNVVIIQTPPGSTMMHSVGYPHPQQYPPQPQQQPQTAVQPPAQQRDLLQTVKDAAPHAKSIMSVAAGCAPLLNLCLGKETANKIQQGIKGVQGGVSSLAGQVTGAGTGTSKSSGSGGGGGGGGGGGNKTDSTATGPVTNVQAPRSQQTPGTQEITHLRSRDDERTDKRRHESTDEHSDNEHRSGSETEGSGDTGTDHSEGETSHEEQHSGDEEEEHEEEHVDDHQDDHEDHHDDKH